MTKSSLVKGVAVVAMIVGLAAASLFGYSNLHHMNSNEVFRASDNPKTVKILKEANMPEFQSQIDQNANGFTIHTQYSQQDSQTASSNQTTTSVQTSNDNTEKSTSSNSVNVNNSNNQSASSSSGNVSVSDNETTTINVSN